MLIASEFYEANLELSEKDLESIYRLYSKWCVNNNQLPECTESEFIRNTFMYLDHVIYHAQITDPDFIKNLLERTASV